MEAEASDAETSDAAATTLYRARGRFRPRSRRGRRFTLLAGLVAVGLLVGGIFWYVSSHRALTVPTRYQAIVSRAATTCSQVTVPLLAAQLDAESGWNARADSGQAQGIAQFTPTTWAEWGGDYDGSGSASVWDPGDAIPAQARYMCSLFRQTANVPGDATANALAAYNAGPTAVVNARGVPDYAETKAYVNRIEADLEPRYAKGLKGPK